MKEIVLEKYPEAIVTTSAETSPRILEYERFTTTILNVGLIPIMSEYLGDLEDTLSARGYNGDLLIAHSAGGLMGLDTTRRVPVRTANSGPAAGAIAAREIGHRAGFRNLVGLDIGGTSTDVSVVENSKLRTSQTWQVEWGHPIMFPAVDVVAVGAGGGSVAWFDAGGKLRNGPMSMGATPGPACYDRGGRTSTNTDAHIVLGTLSPDRFLGGAMHLNPTLAEEVIGETIAPVLGTDVTRAADAIIAVAEANIANAITLATVRRGLDPRDFALLAFGGAGPLHGARVARELHIPTTIVPPNPGLTSAMGCFYADIRHDLGQSLFYTDALTADPDKLDQVFREFEAELRQVLRRENVEVAHQRLERTIDMCYAGQWRVLEVSAGRRVTRRSLRACVSAFQAAHEHEVGFALPERAVEIHGLSVAGVGLKPKPSWHFKPEDAINTGVVNRTRDVYWRELGKSVETQIYDRAALRTGAIVSGPGIIEQMDSTTVIPPDMFAEVDAHFNLLITEA
jgi:N-methylhydantoinase A